MESVSAMPKTYTGGIVVKKFPPLKIRGGRGRYELTTLRGKGGEAGTKLPQKRKGAEKVFGDKV